MDYNISGKNEVLFHVSTAITNLRPLDECMGPFADSSRKTADYGMYLMIYSNSSSGEPFGSRDAAF